MAVDPNSVSIDTPYTVPTDTVDIASANTAPPLPPEVASTRASDAYYGLSGLVNKTPDDIRTAITTGKEPQLRTEVAASLDSDKAVDKQNQIQKLAAEPSPTNVAQIMDMAKTPIKQTDPNSVFEDTSAVKYTSQLYTQFTPNFTWLNEVIQEHPEETQGMVDAATEAVSKWKFSQTMEQNALAKKAAQPWLSITPSMSDEDAEMYRSLGVEPPASMRGTIPNIAKNLTFILPIVEEQLKLNNLSLPEAETDLPGPHTTGERLEAIRQELYKLPYPAYKKVYTDVMEKLSDDPDFAATFSHAMTGQNVSDTAFDYLNHLGAATEVGGLIRFGQATGNLIRATPGFNDVNPAVAAAAGVGDLGEASVQKSMQNIINEFAGNNREAKRALEDLTSNFKDLIVSTHANPGNYGAEATNRLSDMIEAGASTVMDAVTNSMRVNRTPVATASEDVIRMVRENIKGNYKGPENSILNVEGPLENPVSNVPYYNVKIGTQDAEFFKDIQTARGFAKLNDIVLRPTVTQEFNRLNQEISVARKAGADVTPLQAERDAFRAKNIEGLRDTSISLPATEGATIENDGAGAGYYINYVVHNPEKSDVVRATLITQPKSKVGEYIKGDLRTDNVSTSIPPSRLGNWINGSIVGRWRTPAETVSKAENTARQIATFGPSRQASVVDQLAKPIREIPLQQQKDFERFLIAGQHLPDEDGIPGRFFNSPKEVSDWYFNNLGRLPSTKEMEGYYAVRNLNEYDLVLRKITDYRNRAINSVEQMQFKAGDISSGFFDGIKHTKFPGGDTKIALINGDDISKSRFMYLDNMGKYGELIKKRFKEGQGEVWEVWDPETKPLKNLGKNKDGEDFADQFIRYVYVTGSAERKPISWNAIPQRGGGHLTPDYPWYIKQANVIKDFVGVGDTLKRRDIYTGDRTLMPMDIQAKGQNIADNMNQVRTLIAKGDWDAARKLHLDLELPFDWDQHKSWYKPGRGPGGIKLDPRLTADQEIRVVPKDKSILDMDSSLRERYGYRDADGNYHNSFRDGTSSGSAARLASVEFTGKRDAYELHTIGDGGKGSIHDPIYQYQPANYIDPITAMNRGLSRIINSFYLDDYKQFAIEHWVRNAQKHLKADTPNDIWGAPMHYFYNGELKDGTPYRIKKTLENNRQAILDFIGRKNADDGMLQELATGAANYLYNKNGNTKIAVAAYDKLSELRNPVNFFRSWATQAHMGFYHPSTLFTQAATIANVMAISPRHAFSGTSGTFLYGLSRINKNSEMLNAFDKIASNFINNADWAQVGFKPGQWIEATKAMERSGFNTVGNEHGYISTPITVSTSDGWGKDALNILGAAGEKYIKKGGMIPFTLGAGSTRVSAYYTAYLEWAEKNAGKVMGRADEEQVLSRAALLDHNMNRSANSVVHTGLMSVPFQFQSYSIRLAEMVWGKQLTPMEKTRLIGTNALLYGVNMGPLALAGIPAYNYIRENMLRKGIPVDSDTLRDKLKSEGYVMGDNLMVSASMEGMLSYSLAFLTGNGDPRKGTWYDFSRWGNKGIDPIANLWSDKDWWETVTNVVGGDLKNDYNQASGLRMWVKDLLSWDTPETAEKYHLTVRDFTDLAKVTGTGQDVTSLYNSLKSYDGNWNALKWYTKNGTYDGNLTLGEALTTSVMGIKPQFLQDNFLRGDVDKQMRDNERNAEKDFEVQIRRFIMAQQSGAAPEDKDQAEVYMKNALSILGHYNVREDRIGPLLSKALKGYESQFMQTTFDFYTKYAPDKQRLDAIKSYQKELQLRSNQ